MIDIAIANKRLKEALSNVVSNSIKRIKQMEALQIIQEKQRLSLDKKF